MRGRAGSTVLLHRFSTRAALLLPLLALPAAGDDALGVWKPAGALTVGRYAPAAILVGGGRVLVAGGYSFETGATHATSELFDPAAGEWSEGPRMRLDRNFPAVIALADGETLFIGGFRGAAGTTASCEKLDRDVRFAADAPALIEERELFAAVRLADGRFLITGGYSTLRRRTLDTAERYDPAAGRFERVPGRLRSARFGHDMVLLPDRRVLVVGGKVLSTNESVREAELFDPLEESFEAAGTLAVGRDRCTAWLLPGGESVLVAGGSTREGGTEPARRCELYDVAARRFSPGAELLRDRMAHTATGLGGGRVLLVGGWSTSEGATTRETELWDPAQRRFLAAGRTEHGRHDHGAVLLPDGRVLIAGGKEAPARHGVETPLAAEVWSPAQR